MMISPSSVGLTANYVRLGGAAGATRPARSSPRPAHPPGPERTSQWTARPEQPFGLVLTPLMMRSGVTSSDHDVGVVKDGPWQREGVAVVDQRQPAAIQRQLPSWRSCWAISESKNAAGRHHVGFDVGARSRGRPAARSDSGVLAQHARHDDLVPGRP